MQVSKVYRALKCEKLAMFDTLSTKKSRNLVLYEQIREIADMLQNKTEKEEILTKVEENLEKQYEENWFPFPWQRKITIENDIFIFRRFLNFFDNSLTVVEANRFVSIAEKTLCVDDKELSCNVPIIAQTPSGNHVAFHIFFKAADKSPGGKSIHTSTNTDLYSMVTKYALEKEFPNIEIELIYLCREDDTIEHMSDSLVRCNTKKSNIFVNKFENLYEDNNFNQELCLTLINSALSQKMKHSCYDCDKKGACTTPSIDTIRNFTRMCKDSSYKVPNYTEEQQEVVNHIDGPLVVSAPPGSGKTAVLVGRIKNLVIHGVMPESILAIGFTNEAVNELANRCEEFAIGSKFSTINALGYEILQANEHIVGKMELLSPANQVEIVKKLISVMNKPLSGFKYGMEYGKNGLYKTVANKIEAYIKASDKDAFLIKNKLDNSFSNLVSDYLSIVKAKGYITFDEQVILCNKLFRDYPEVANSYSNLYKYVMVDEFQDISLEQAEFISTIAAHENLVVVGDDDQGIYGFRGGSNKFLIEFSKRYACKTIVLSNNFRSTQEIVQASQSLISNNEIRIPKKVIANGGHGTKPMIINGVSSAVMDNIIEHCVSKGYAYGDIAIISTKNAILEEYKETLASPCILAKSYLIHDPLFVVIKSLLELNSNIDNDFAMYQLMSVLGVETVGLKKSSESLYRTYLSTYGFNDTPLDHKATKEEKPLELIKMMDLFIKEGYKADVIVRAIAFNLSVDGSPSEDSFLSLLETEKIENITLLADKMDYMVRFEDETRVPVEQGDKVLLITSHDSKGREFPVVIMIDDYSENSEEGRRLFYVAMTRAKKELYVCKSLVSQTDYTNEFMNAFAV